MPQHRTPKERLLDIQNAIAKIASFLSNKDYAAFVNEPMLHDAVVQNLSVISEASRHLPNETKQREPDIQWRNVADMGNWLRHGYDVVNDQILWDTVERDLPALREAVTRLLSNDDI
jgi:uncharacterized protein with HEPN domain